MRQINSQNYYHNYHLHSGLAFTGQKSYQINKNAHIERGRNSGKMVLTDLLESPELFEIIGVLVEGKKGAVITLRSLSNNKRITVDNFKKIRQARSNEVLAKARQGSDGFNYFWQKRNTLHQY